MNPLKKFRSSHRVSQRQLAQSSGLAFRTIQLLESPKHDPQISTLEKVFRALGFPAGYFKEGVDRLWKTPRDSIYVSSQQALRDDEATWKIWLFNFVDAFRKNQDPASLIQAAPDPRISPRLYALIASTVEQLCAERSLVPPTWTLPVSELERPWFVSGVENLKASALVESPLHFRKRNIFVLGNFLERR